MAVIRHVVTIGGGFSGALYAVNLVRHDGPRVTLIERSEEAGQGLAYGAAHPTHLLNVRAANMSAFPDEPDHFVRWLAARGEADPASAFVPRTTYGEYLQDLLREAQQRAGDRLTIRTGYATDLEVGPDGVTVTLSDGDRIAADAATLALGNLPPHAPPGLAALDMSPGRYWPDPWAPGLAEGLTDDDTVLVVGTGLTMVDVALMLELSAFKGRIIALSRRGLLPLPHAAGVPFERRTQRPGTRVSALVRDVRQRADAIGWRQAVDELRPFTQDLWRAASRAEQSRFLRHLRPWWDVHRHRLAPQVHARLHALIDAGRLDVRAGKLVAFDEKPSGVEVTWRPRGADDLATFEVQRIVNCTGPEGNLPSASQPVLRKLLARGTIRPDRLRIGVDVDARSRAIMADGRPNERVFALGPLTRGAFWEISAVPDIRAQVWDLARHASNAHWVGGEGL